MSAFKASPPIDALAPFHPTVRAWFQQRFAAPTEAQAAGWPAIHSGRDTLIAAPTGSGKTLAAFLAGIDGLLRAGEAADLADEITILYISPLKALASDIHRNLEAPLAEIRELAATDGITLPIVRTAVRSGDTTPSARQAITRRPPHILITTPESLYLMLTAERSRTVLRHVRTVIVDEIHALVRDKRGSHLALSLARLDHVADARPVRIGLSATQKPMEEIAAFLVGSERIPPDGQPDCEIIDCGHQRDLALTVEVPPSELAAVASHEQWGETYDRLAELINAHRTTLIFVNTRRHAERVAHHLAERLDADQVASYHGSLAKERRLQLEQRLKAGELRALVATASLELGIDIGAIDLVCQIGSPHSIATFLQRVGRSGHALGLTPQGALFPLTRDELVECAALVRAVRNGRLDHITQPRAPLDVLAQQIVAECAAEPWLESTLFDLVRSAAPYRTLTRDDYNAVITMLSEGIGEGAGRARPLLHRDRIGGMLRGRREARLTALVNGGVIPETGDYQVIAEPDETVVGSVGEDWAIESMGGDIFLLGSTSWQIKRVEAGRVRVVDAQGAPPTIPFWLGEGPGRTRELSAEVSALRREVAAGLNDTAALSNRLRTECELSEPGAAQIMDYIRATRDSLGLVPSDTDVVFERFFDETGGQQLVVHAPFGARITRAWGLALRKRFCVRFDFELQAAAIDDGMVLSLGPTQSFPLTEAFDYLRADNAEESLRRAAIFAPFWATRWRWTATRALAVPRRRASRKVPPQIQRRIAEDVMAAVFPALAGCQENVTAPPELPDHPLIRQTMTDCLREAMDTDGLVEILQRIEAGEIRLHARDTTAPSPLALAVINASPYAFLDNAPLEERRTRAVMQRRSLPDDSRDLGALDTDAIRRVRTESWPDPRDLEETHDALLNLVAVDAVRLRGWESWLTALTQAGRAATLRPPTGGLYWFAAEHLPAMQLLYPNAQITPTLTLPEGAALPVDDREDARTRMLRGHAEALGPVTVADLAASTGLGVTDVERGLAQVEALGHVLRGRFTHTDPGKPEEYCDRRLLARIHHSTLDRLRREIDPVSAQDYMRFLLRWQHLTLDSRLYGRAGLRTALRKLRGFEAPATAWERHLLPGRVADYQPGWLDELCLTGEVTWSRLTPKVRSGRNGAGSHGYNGAVPSQSMPVGIVPRALFRDILASVRHSSGAVSGTEDAEERGAAAAVLNLLRDRGALFFDELVRDSRRLATDVEGGLRTLVARGLVHADGFEPLRQLVTGQRRRRRRRPAYGPGGVFLGGGPSGRWALVPSASEESAEPPTDRDALAEQVAEALLDRYGVIFLDLTTRESFTLPWRDVLSALRRMEARGVVRGGRFVSGFVGEQYALPEAVAALRAERRRERRGERLYVSAVDPCNLAGIVLPGGKVTARAHDGLLLVDGVLVDGATANASSDAAARPTTPPATTPATAPERPLAPSARV